MNELQKAQSEIAEAQAKLNAAQARIEELSKPVEREYRAGEWVPDIRCTYFYKNGEGLIDELLNCNDPIDKENFRTGNVSPTRAIAEAAKAHADWWREFDMSDEGGEWGIGTYGGKIVVLQTRAGIHVNYSNPKYLLSTNARAVIARLGGEQKVIEMLNTGRVFRFKWGGQ